MRKRARSAEPLFFSRGRRAAPLRARGVFSTRRPSREHRGKGGEQQRQRQAKQRDAIPLGAEDGRGRDRRSARAKADHGLPKSPVPARARRARRSRAVLPPMGRISGVSSAKAEAGDAPRPAIRPSAAAIRSAPNTRQRSSSPSAGRTPPCFRQGRRSGRSDDHQSRANRSSRKSRCRKTLPSRTVGKPATKPNAEATTTIARNGWKCRHCVATRRMMREARKRPAPGLKACRTSKIDLVVGKGPAMPDCARRFRRASGDSFVLKHDREKRSPVFAKGRPDSAPLARFWHRGGSGGIDEGCGMKVGDGAALGCGSVPDHARRRVFWRPGCRRAAPTSSMPRAPAWSMAAATILPSRESISAIGWSPKATCSSSNKRAARPRSAGCHRGTDRSARRHRVSGRNSATSMSPGRYPFHQGDRLQHRPRAAGLAAISSSPASRRRGPVRGAGLGDCSTGWCMVPRGGLARRSSIFTPRLAARPGSITTTARDIPLTFYVPHDRAAHHRAMAKARRALSRRNGRARLRSI